MKSIIIIKEYIICRKIWILLISNCFVLFLNNKTLLYKVPKRKADETMFDYLKRIQVPQDLSVDTGYNVIDRFHESQLIIPIYEE